MSDSKAIYWRAVTAIDPNVTYRSLDGVRVEANMAETVREVNWLSVNCSVEQLDASPAYRRCNRDGTWIVGVADQPAPVGGEGRPIWELVIEDMKERDQLGRERYGTPLRARNGRVALVDLYHELLDAVVYCRQELAERGSKVGPLCDESHHMTVDYAIEVVKTINSKGTSQHPMFDEAVRRLAAQYLWDRVKANTV